MNNSQFKQTSGEIKRVAVVTNFIEGLYPTSLTTEHYSKLFEKIKNQGVELNVITTCDERVQPRTGSIWYWQSLLNANGINLLIPPANKLTNNYPEPISQSFRVFKLIESQQFDWVHFDDLDGLAYCSLVSRHKFLPNTVITSAAISPQSWKDLFKPKNYLSIYVRYLQETSYQLADGFISCSRTIPKWIENSIQISDKTLLLTEKEELKINKNKLKSIVFIEDDSSSKLFAEVDDGLVGNIKKEHINLDSISLENSSRNFKSIRQLLEHHCSSGALLVISPTSIEAILSLEYLEEVKYPALTLKSFMHAYPNERVAGWNKEEIIQRIKQLTSYSTFECEFIEYFYEESLWWIDKVSLIKQNLPNKSNSFSLTNNDEENLNNIIIGQNNNPSNKTDPLHNNLNIREGIPQKDYNLCGQFSKTN